MVLTICIPTYSRAENLVRSLERLMPQVVAQADDVCVIVSDNCSPDRTEDCMRAMCKRYPQSLTYIRQKTNLGSQANFAIVAGMAKTRYICLMGDDDYVRPDYVETVLTTLRSHPDVGLVYYNALRCREGEGLMVRQDDLGAWLNLRDKVFGDFENRAYATGGELLKAHLEAPSLMSSLVFEREDFLREKAKVCDGDYPGYEWFMALCRSVIHKPCVYVSKPILINNVPLNIRWIEKWPLYVMCGLSHIFKDLDVEIPGLFEKWNETFASSWLKNSVLLGVKGHRNLYGARIAEMRKYACDEVFANELEDAAFLKWKFQSRIDRDLGKILWAQYEVSALPNGLLKKILHFSRFACAHPRQAVCAVRAKAMHELPEGGSLRERCVNRCEEIVRTFPAVSPDDVLELRDGWRCSEQGIFETGIRMSVRTRCSACGGGVLVVSLGLDSHEKGDQVVLVRVDGEFVGSLTVAASSGMTSHVLRLPRNAVVREGSTIELVSKADCDFVFGGLRICVGKKWRKRPLAGVSWIGAW